MSGDKVDDLCSQVFGAITVADHESMWDNRRFPVENITMPHGHYIDVVDENGESFRITVTRQLTGSSG